MKNVYALHEKLISREVQFAYQGVINQSIMVLVAKHLRTIPETEYNTKRLFAVTVEVCQNIYHHSLIKLPHINEDGEEVQEGYGFIALAETESAYHIFGGNYIDNSGVKHIHERVNLINSLEKDELRTFYREQRRQPPRKNSPGAYLGLIDMKRKSENNLDISFVPDKNDEKRSFYSISLKILKNIKLKDFHLEQTEYVPTVDFNADTGVLEMSGESYHENAKKVFEPIILWLHKYLSIPGKEVIFNFRMSYFNTSSSKRILEILLLLEEYSQTKEGNVIVNWYYESYDYDMMEQGQEYAEDIQLPINLIAT